MALVKETHKILIEIHVKVSVELPGLVNRRRIQQPFYSAAIISSICSRIHLLDNETQHTTIFHKTYVSTAAKIGG